MDLRVYNQILSLDPGENQKPHGLFQDYNSELLASPTINVDKLGVIIQL